MTPEEFARIDPQLAYALRAFAGPRHAIDGVYRDTDGRWVAHLCGIDGWEIAVEARCLPACREARGYAWVWLEHECCAECEVDPGHRYRDVHE